MKTFFGIFILSVVLNLCAAQVKIDVVAGAGIATFSGSDAVSWGRSFSDPKPKIKFHVGVSLRYLVGEDFTFEPGLVYSMKGASYEGITVAYSYEEPYENPYTVTTRRFEFDLSYLEVPLMLAYKPGKKLHFVAGLKPGLRLSANETTFPEGVPSSRLNAKESFKFIEITAATGVRYDISEKLALQLAYETGLNNIGKIPYRPYFTVNGSQEIHNYYTAKIRNSAFRLSIIYRIKQ